MTGKSEIAEQALALIQKLYGIEAEIRKNTDGSAEQRCQYRQKYSQPVMQQLHTWLIQHQNAVPSSSATAKAINYIGVKPDCTQPSWLFCRGFLILYSSKFYGDEFLLCNKAFQNFIN